MLYFRCPTCRTILANKQVLFEEELDNICKNDKLSKKESDAAKQNLLDRLELRNMCCRPRMLTYIKLVDVVK